MQTAVDCNGSSSSSSSGSFTIATVTTIMQSEMLAAHEGTMPTSLTLTTEQAPHVLGRRMPPVKVGMETNAIAGHQPGHSDVETIASTPSTSPHASPTRKQPEQATIVSSISNSRGSKAARAIADVAFDAQNNADASADAGEAKGNEMTPRERAAGLVIKLLPLLPHSEQQLCPGTNQGGELAACTPMKSCLPTPTSSSSSASSPAPLTPSSSSQCSTPSSASTGCAALSKTSLAPLSLKAKPKSQLQAQSQSQPQPQPQSKPKSSLELELLHWQDMPQYLQFNPYVLEGYRPLQTFKGCLLSLFYWHNETINILTHAIPIVYILAIVPGLMPWEHGYRFLSFCHVFGSVAPWCGSFVYHLFMNIERGENVYYRLLKLDMLGIWVSQSFGALPLVTATTWCFTYHWKWSIIISYCLMCLWGLYKALTACSPWQRRLCFALPFTMRSILTLMRTVGTVGGNSVALPHVYLQLEVDGVSILGGAIGAMRIPEKWFPGLVDFYLNSHNIMHVLVVIAVYSMHKATIKDFEWMSATTCDAFTNATSEAIDAAFTPNAEL